MYQAHQDESRLVCAVAERIVLGKLLQDAGLVATVSSMLREDDFCTSRHRLIYRCIGMVASKHRVSDLLLVYDAALSHGGGEGIGGMGYLAELAAGADRAADVRRYAELVRDKAIARRLVDALEGALNDALNPQGRSVCELLAQAEARLADVRRAHDCMRPDGTDVRGILQGIVARAGKTQGTSSGRTPRITGLPTGFYELDDMTLGLQSGELVVIAGRPSMGKTALLMNIVEHVAIREKLQVLVFSMEMTSGQLVTRIVSSAGMIRQRSIWAGGLDGKELSTLEESARKVGDAKILIDDRINLSPTDVRSSIVRMTERHGKISLVAIDYIQLMASANCAGNRYAEVSDISRSLKNISRELGVPVIAISQLNRGLEQRANKRPVMSDLRESGAIEQDADLILFIYRDEVYNNHTKDKGVAEIIVGKHRNGPTGSIRLNFLGEYMKFVTPGRPKADG
ncbi:Replicative DNA helicase [Candidatus Tremblaya princeps]|uniref:Replicative DNA helicase n=1 Tax=Tremblaya princeps TaxID=189385 RepID=A0A143WNC6_TREPR|nr:Replicative DNA helicase [Candidatus Tremblaya princeps]